MVVASAPGSRPIEELKRVDRRRAFADLEMQLRRSDLARLAGLGNDLAALNGVAALHQHFTRVGISGDVAVRVPNQNQLAEAWTPLPKNPTTRPRAGSTGVPSAT